VRYLKYNAKYPGHWSGGCPSLNLRIHTVETCASDGIRYLQSQFLLPPTIMIRIQRFTSFSLRLSVIFIQCARIVLPGHCRKLVRSERREEVRILCPCLLLRPAESPQQVPTVPTVSGLSCYALALHYKSPDRLCWELADWCRTDCMTMHNRHDAHEGGLCAQERCPGVNRTSRS
jgi:hypothetical protein